MAGLTGWGQDPASFEPSRSRDGGRGDILTVPNQ